MAARRATAPPERPEDAIRAERKKRDYLSLFASNVALSYRKGPSASPARRGSPPRSPVATDRQRRATRGTVETAAGVSAARFTPSAKEFR